LTKHLTHIPLWTLIKDHLFFRYNENDIVEVMQVVYAAVVAPDGEYHAGNGIGPGHTTRVFDDSWHPVLIGDHYYLVQSCIVEVPAYASMAVFWTNLNG
jgi:hypothetical protein